MISLTENNQNNSVSFRKKIVPYEDYLQIKNAYINLKEKIIKLKEEKQNLESLLNQYQSAISDYKTSNNTIKLIFKKLEKKYQESYAFFQKTQFNNMSIAKNNNFKIQNNKKYKTISEDEYKRNINKYIENINQLKKEIKLKEELLESKNKENMEIILENKKIKEEHKKFKKLFVSKNIQFNLINIPKKNLIARINYNNLTISSNICEYNILKGNKSNKYSFIEKNFIISSKSCELKILKKDNPKGKKINLISQSKTNEINIIKIPKISKPQIKNKKVHLSISSICLFTIEKINKEKKLGLFSKVCELSIIKKNKNQNKLIISPKACEYNIYFDDKKKLNIASKAKLFQSSLMVNSKVNDICIKKITKKVLLEIKSKVSELIIEKSKIKNYNFKIENQQLSFIKLKIKKVYKGQNQETQKAIIDNYINSINIGFDNIKVYEDYNEINNEKDADSDNENDKLECEPVPSFILCIQKKEKVK